MKKFTQITSCVALIVTMIACNTGAGQERKAIDESMNQEKEFLREAIRHRSPDVQKVDIIGNTVVYTHIFNGIIDEKTYTYDGAKMATLSPSCTSKDKSCRRFSPITKNFVRFLTEISIMLSSKSQRFCDLI